MISGSTGPGSGPSIWSRWRDSFGETHLTLDAMVAHVDGELAPGPDRRAAEHVARCLPCASEVAAHRRTRGQLRTADAPGAPSSLLSALRAIADEPRSPAGSAPSATADAGAGDESGDDGSRARHRSGVPRGLPVAVASGIALGAVALAAVPSLPMTAQIARSVGPGVATGAGASLRGPGATSGPGASGSARAPAAAPATTTADPTPAPPRPARAGLAPAPGVTPGPSGSSAPPGPPGVPARPGPDPAH